MTSSTPLLRTGRLPLVEGLVAAALLVATAVSAAAPSAGERLYRDGVGPTGQPLKALVAGDVGASGAALACQNCHGRSGLGSTEGAYVVPAIAGRVLFAATAARPGYDRASLGRALREGVTTTERQLGALMPRYDLRDAELDALVHYLEGLSARSSPGVDATTIRFATVVAGDIPATERDAVLAVLRAYVDEKNRQTRLESRRPAHGPGGQPPVYRDWALDEWLLRGPADSWAAQLEGYYNEGPVFAVLGGLVRGSWRPIGDFCEREGIPCLFPSVDAPSVQDSDRYSFHFSNGIELEAELIAHDLANSPRSTVMQAYCEATANAAQRLRDALAATTMRVEDVVFPCNEPLTRDSLSRYLGTADAALVLWARRGELPRLAEPLHATRVYVSATLLENDVGSLEEIGGSVRAAQPFRLATERDPALARFRAWAHTRGLAASHVQHQAEAFFACLAANDAIAHLHGFFVRDYVLDMFEHAQGLAPYVPLYPRASFGPGQRVSSRGGYLLSLDANAPEPRWIVPSP